MGLLNPTAWICIGLGVVNALAGSVYGYVKRMARQGKKRVGDCKLLLWLWGGPFLATAAMVRYEHKTRKRLFMINAVLANMVQVGLCSYLLVTGTGAFLELALFTASGAAVSGLSLLTQYRRGCACEGGSDHSSDTKQSLLEQEHKSARTPGAVAKEPSASGTGAGDADGISPPDLESGDKNLPSWARG